MRGDSFLGVVSASAAGDMVSPGTHNSARPSECWELHVPPKPVQSRPFNFQITFVCVFVCARTCVCISWLAEQELGGTVLLQVPASVPALTALDD